MNVRGYDNHKGVLFNHYLDEMLEEGDVSFIIEELIDEINIESLYQKISERGNPAYHPKMMLKVLFMAYTIGVYSSRKIEKLLKNDVRFMYLSGRQKPNFRTISDFRKNNIKEIGEIFKEVVKVSDELGMVGLKLIAIDSSVIKGNASLSKSWDEKRIDKEIERMLKEAEEIDRIEDEKYGKEGREEEIEVNIKDKKKRKEEIKKVIEKLKKDKEKLKEGKEKKINTTDEDSKIQRGRNGYCSGYRLGVAVDGKEGVIVGVEVENEQCDSNLLVPIIEKVEEVFGKEIKEKGENGEKVEVVADSGFSGMKTLRKIKEKEEFDCYIPDMTYEARKRGKRQEGEYDKSKFRYDEEGDFYECIEGKKLKYKKEERIKNGEVGRRYQGTSECKRCKHFGKCTTNKNGRNIVKYEEEESVLEMREKIGSEKGQEVYGKRKGLIERVFGDIKCNNGFRWFNLRGKRKVRGEGVLVCIGYNLKKIWNYTRKLSISVREKCKEIRKMKEKVENIGRNLEVKMA